MQIAICDDLQLDINDLRRIVDTYDFCEPVTIEEFTTGSALIDRLESGFFDLIFLDIHLDLDSTTRDWGIVFAMQIKKINPNTMIIFMSLYEEFFKPVAQLGLSNGYLLKPFDHDAVIKKVEEVYHLIKKSLKKYYYVTINGETHQIDLNKVLYFESTHRKIRMKLANRMEYEFYGKLDDVFEEVFYLYPFFARANKSFILNVLKVKKFTKQCAAIDELEVQLRPSYNFTLEMLKLIRNK